jgi:hypothetical protein
MKMHPNHRWANRVAIVVALTACTSGGGGKGNGGAPGTGGRTDARGSGGATTAPTGGVVSGVGGSAGVGTGGRGGGAGSSGISTGGAAGTGGDSRGTGGVLATGGVTSDSGSTSDGAAGKASGGAVGRDSGNDAPGIRDASGSDAVTALDAANIAGTNNPVLPGYTADPNIAVFDGTFYLYPTTDGVADWGATSFSVFSSTNLVEWTNRGVVLDIPTALTWAKGHGWAPSITRVGSTYYFYFSADSQIGVATGTSPTGPFKDALGKPLATTRQYGPQSIDPYAFIDDDGTPYLYFGSASGGLLVAKLAASMTSFTGTPTNISPGGATGTLEGSAMFKRNGSYYLVWSEGDTRNATYQMAYARAQAPLGPFTRLATILKQDTALGILGPGGGTILAIPSRDEYYVVYHRFKIPGGDGTHREVCIDRMTFNADGTIVPVKPTLAGLQTAVSP